jgi:hypothetical protein
MKTPVVWLVVGMLPLLAQGAEVYKYVDDRGVVHYTDKPPPGAKKADLPELQTYSSDPAAAESPVAGPPVTNPAADTGTVTLPPEAAALGFYSSVKIVSPTPDQTYHTADAQVTAAASVEPELQASQGHRLVFYVDGAARPPEPGQTSLVLQGLERGTHQVSAAVLDDQGQVLRQSPPVSFHMLPPTVFRKGKH